MIQERTLMGFTYHQLHGAMTNAELTACVVAFSVDQMRQNPECVKAMGPKMDEFLKLARRECEAMMREMPTAKMWDHMRNVYDSREKFVGAIEMMSEMGNMSVIIAKATQRVIEQLMDSEPNERAVALH